MSQLPLEGIRILDLSSIWAGPWGTQLLAYLGAEIVKIESITRMDPWRGPSGKTGPKHRYPDGDRGEDPYNRDAFFNSLNRNKLGVTLDLTKAEGKDIFRRLVKISDVVLENFRSGQMEKFGLGWEDLSKINPAIIMVSLPGYGNTGPYKDFLAWGPVLEAVCGMANLVGYKDGPPILSGNAYIDAISGAAACAAVMTALFSRKRSGKGVYVDLSQLEAATTFVGPLLVGNQFEKTVNPRKGNDSDSFAPYGCYRCKGEDQWVAISVETDEQWEKFCRAIGDIPWTKLERFKSALERWINRGELNSLVESWTRQKDKYEVMKTLQDGGVCAGALLMAKELMVDPHFVAQNFFVSLFHPSMGERTYPGIPFSFGDDYGIEWKPAPHLGEHNHYVFHELLGMGDDELQRLTEKGIIGTKPDPLKQVYG
jgi:crotonobetainyl-CoA:carnitine CoA-transferase CaiB-like acyl-CoA transferase